MASSPRPEPCRAPTTKTKSNRRPAAVDGEGGAGHQGRGVGGEEDDGAHEVLDRAEAAERDAGERFGAKLGIGEERRGHARADEGRAERVDPDAVRGEV